MSTAERFVSFLEHNGAIDVSAEDIVTEQAGRVSVEGDKADQKSGLYKLFMNEGHGKPAGFFNNYRTGTYDKWVDNEVQIASPMFAVSIHKRKQLKDLESKAEQTKKFTAFQEEWKSMRPANRLHQYAKIKDLGKQFFDRAEVKTDKRGNLALAVRDSNGTITNIQRVWRNGTKQLEQGGRVAGSFVKIIGINKNKSFVLVTEGVSTGETLNKITDIDTYASLTSNNLANVAKIVRKKHPDAVIIVAADNDYHLTQREKPLKNTGLLKAIEAAMTVGGYVAPPPFTKDELLQEKTDWKDYEQMYGIQKTRDALKKEFVKSTQKEQNSSKENC